MVSREDKQTLSRIVDGSKITKDFGIASAMLVTNSEFVAQEMLEDLSPYLGLQDAMRRWQDTTCSILQELATSLEVHEFRYLVRLEGTAQQSYFHRDGLGPGKGAFLRTISGPATFFAADEDALTERDTIRPETSSLWTIRPWAVAFLWPPSREKDCVHTRPFDGRPSSVSTRRCMEAVDFYTNKKLVRPSV
jgi:hypothetical protein